MSESIDLFRLAFEASEQAALITDQNAIIVRANPALAQIYGYTPEELQGQSCRIFQSGLTSAVVYQSLWQTLTCGKIWEGNLLNRNKDGERCWQHLRIIPLRSEIGINHYFVSMTSLADLHCAQPRIDWHTSFDALTGLPNRSHFLARLKAEIRDLAGKDQQLTLVRLDIDNFSSINVKYGEQTGDLVLKRLGKRLKNTIRQGDILARVSNDEFGLILRGSQIDEQHQEVIQRFLDTLSGQPLTDEITPIEVTFSMGVSVFPQDGNNADSLMLSADQARQIAQQEGGNRFVFHRGAQSQALDMHQTLIKQLQYAIEHDELILHYQPQVSLVSGEIIGFEALVRWNHPERGLLPPMQFIPLAEETGLIIPLSEWVLRTACQQLGLWCRSGLPKVRMAVNMSAQHFHLNTLPSLVTALLFETGVAPHQLELELTENMMLHDTATAIEIVDQVKTLGVQLSLDDFGTGYSSLAYLSRLSIDALKIDQSFVRDITSNPVNASIVLATIAMAHKLGMRVIAEGVENEAQRFFLQRHGCDEMQGFGFSRPLPAAHATAMLEGRKKLTLENNDQDHDNHPTLLLLDDEPSIINALRRLFHHEGYRIFFANSAADALELLAIHRIDIVLSDQRMPEMTGVEFLSRVKELYPSIIRIVLSGYTDIDTVTDAINKGAIYKFFSKPWDDEDLREEIRRIFRSLRE